MQIGRIVKALSGFYNVRLEDGTSATCRARGNVRKGSQMPLTGDLVRISRHGANGMIEEILPRRNAFLRPAVSNLDALVIFAADTNPVTEPFLIDRVAAIAGNQSVPVLLCINKCDLAAGDRLADIYGSAGFSVFRTSAATGAGIQELRATIRGRLTAFTGNSGVGKSSVLNAMCPGLMLQVGEVSEKLGRGRHTTRHVELFDLGENTLVADTPGFSSFDTDQMEIILKDNLQYAFPDFAPFLGKCQFRDCSHRREPGCAITAAVSAGTLQESRYTSYVRLYEKASEIPDWQLKK